MKRKGMANKESPKESRTLISLTITSMYNLTIKTTPNNIARAKKNTNDNLCQNEFVCCA